MNLNMRLSQQFARGEGGLDGRKACAVPRLSVTETRPLAEWGSERTPFISPRALARSLAFGGRTYVMGVSSSVKYPYKAVPHLHIELVALPLPSPGSGTVPRRHTNMQTP